MAHPVASAILFLFTLIIVDLILDPFIPSRADSPRVVDTSPFCHITIATSARKVLTISNGLDRRYLPTVRFKPDLYYEKSLRHALRQALRQGKPPVAGCRKLSQRLIAEVEPGSTFATACIATWDATCIATWETQVASWALANHVCFPLVALDLRQNSINRPSLSHVAATCRVSHVAAIFS